MKQSATYLVEVKFTDGSHWNYFVDADSAKEAVEEVNCFKDSSEEIIAVFKQLKNWK